MFKVHLNEGDIVIRSVREADAEQLTNWWNDGAVMAHAGFPHGLGQSIEETRRQIARNVNSCAQLLIIELEGTPIGEMNYRALDGHSVEIGIKLCDPTAQNRGLGTLALTLIISYLFRREDVDEIRLDTNVNNTRAQRVYERLGFTRVRVNRDAWRDQDGVHQSSIDYVLTRESWKKTHPED